MSWAKYQYPLMRVPATGGKWPEEEYPEKYQHREVNLGGIEPEPPPKSTNWAIHH